MSDIRLIEFAVGSLTPAQGVQGVQGIIGPQGIQGITGSQGIQGTAAVDGSDGSQGIQGIASISPVTKGGTASNPAERAITTSLNNLHLAIFAVSGFTTTTFTVATSPAPTYFLSNTYAKSGLWLGNGSKTYYYDPPDTGTFTQYMDFIIYLN